MKTIVFGCDHAGLALKQKLIAYVQEQGYSVLDVGTNSEEPVDYPDLSKKAVKEILAGQTEVGVLICGSGIGVSIAANRFRGIRAALCRCEYEARTARSHDNANILCFGQRVIGVEIAKACLDVFLKTSFDGGRHARRVAKLDED